MSLSKKQRLEKKAQAIERIRLSTNPCPGRSESERNLITRYIEKIADEWTYHLAQTEGIEPEWLPRVDITPEREAAYVDAVARYEGCERDEHGYIKQLLGRDQRATNRVRVATWYKNNVDDLYMTSFIGVSPLLDDYWGAVPLTLMQWRILIPSLIATHNHWKWVHAVRRHWQDSSYKVGGSFGWYMEPCKQLIKDNSLPCTGQVIYSHIARRYSERVSGE